MAAISAKAELASLPVIRDYVLGKARDADIPIALEPRLDLVLEEVLVNVATHAYGGSAGAVEVECAPTPEAFCCTVRDWGTPFDPLAQEKPDLATELEERKIGGMGLTLLSTMASECRYVRNGNANELTFCFSF